MNRFRAVVHGAAIQALRGSSFPTFKCWRYYGIAWTDVYNHAAEETAPSKKDWFLMPEPGGKLHWMLKKVCGGLSRLQTNQHKANQE